MHGEGMSAIEWRRTLHDGSLRIIINGAEQFLRTGFRSDCAMTSFDLGTHSTAVTTVSSDAQYWFDQGLNWRFGFNKEESVKCFHKALNYDPDCAMAHWGVAYGVGPFYNLTW